MKRLLLLAALAALPALPQAVRFDTPVYTTQGSCASGRQCPVLAIPGASVYVCTPPLCAARATTYTNAGAGTACATNAQLTPATGGACLATSDSQGNAGFWILPGTYNYYVALPNGGATYGPYPISVQGAAGGYVLDSLYATLALACTAAGSGTLAVTASWNATPTQTLGCHLWFLGNGKIQPSNGATVTLGTGKTITSPAKQIFDYSIGGTVSITNSPSIANVKWFGAACDGSTDDAAPIGYSLLATKSLEFPVGTCVSSTAQAITIEGQRITGAGSGYVPAQSATVLKFTGATSGFTATGSGIYANSIENIHIQATHGSSVDGVRLAGSGTGVVNWALRNLHFTGTWEKAIHAVSSAENLKIIEPTCVDIEVCLYIEGVSNSVDIISPSIGGTYTKGLVVDDSQGVRVHGGTIQGTATYLVENSGSPEGTILIGTWLEGAVTSLIESSSLLTLTDVIIGGGTYTDHGIHQSGVSPLMITGLTGVGQPGSNKCLVQYDGNAGGSAQGLTITGSYVQATDPTPLVGSSRHAICVGTSTTSSSVTVIEGNHLITSVGDNILFDLAGGIHSVRGNYFTSSGYNINATAMADGKLVVQGNNFVSNVESGTPANAYRGNCTGCNYEFALPGTNVNKTLMSFFPVNQTTGALGTRAQIGSCTAARKGLSFPISDADTVVYNAVVSGGGANILNIWCDGTNWRAH